MEKEKERLFSHKIGNYEGFSKRRLTDELLHFKMKSVVSACQCKRINKCFGGFCMFRIIPLLVMLLMFTGISYYLSFRIYKGIAAFLPSMKFWPIMLVVCILVVTMIAGFGRALTPFPKEFKRVLGTVSGYCMGIFMYRLLFTVAADLIFAIPRIMKLTFTSHRLFNGFVAIGVLVLTAVTSIYGFINARQIDHVSYEIGFEGKKDISDIKMVMISDLHLGAIGSESRLQKTVDEINAENPDVVCIAGDFFDTDYTAIRDPESAIEILKGIKSTYGIYASLGNHDGGSTHEQMKEFLKKADITLLDDSYTIIDGRLAIVGRLDASAIGGYGDRQRSAISDYFTLEDESMPVIVLDHNPVHVDEYTTEADLILSGHTHKGQVFPANFVTDMIYTVDYGYYRKDSKSPQVIVSSGVGAWGMPMRVGTDCEIVSISFNPEK